MSVLTSGSHPPAPVWAETLVRRWRQVENAIVMIAFAVMACLLIFDVTGREVFSPILKLLGVNVTVGLFGAQKLAIYALVLASYIGIGIATATAGHLTPRVGFGWTPARWSGAVDRIGDVVSGCFMLAIAWYGYEFVSSTMSSGLQAGAIAVPVWPFQISIPLGFVSAALRYFFFARWPSLRPSLSEFQE